MAYEPLPMRWTLLGFGFYPHVLQFIANHHQPGILSGAAYLRGPPSRCAAGRAGQRCV